MAPHCRAELNPWLRYGQLALHVSSCVLHASRLAWCLACKAFRQARSPPQPGLVAAYRASSAATHCLYVPMHRLAQSFVVTVEPPAARLPTPTITIIATTTTATIATTLFLTMGPIPFVALPRCVSPATPHLTHGSSPVLRWSCQIAQILTLRHRHVHCRPWTGPGSLAGRPDSAERQAACHARNRGDSSADSRPVARRELQRAWGLTCAVRPLLTRVATPVPSCPRRESPPRLRGSPCEPAGAHAGA